MTKEQDTEMYEAYLKANNENKIEYNEQMYEAFKIGYKKAFFLYSVRQSLPKLLSNKAYTNAQVMRYNDFVTWWDEQV